MSGFNINDPNVSQQEVEQARRSAGIDKPSRRSSGGSYSWRGRAGKMPMKIRLTLGGMFAIAGATIAAGNGTDPKMGALLGGIGGIFFQELFVIIAMAFGGWLLLSVLRGG
ncbi:MAG: hypothetical protein P1V20_28510 [Verrucomicrobiales bacterium]|nr:hypothetical protein [Verrucomicrobiales bacterium]